MIGVIPKEEDRFRYVPTQNAKGWATGHAQPRSRFLASLGMTSGRIKIGTQGKWRSDDKPEPGGA